MAGLMFYEEESISRWINRFAKDIKFRSLKMFAELEVLNNGHNYECFQSLDIEVINAEITALHFSAHRFYKKTEVKNKLLSIIQDFALSKDFTLLKMGKLANSATQKNPNFKLAAEEESHAEQGFVKNFCHIYSL